MSTIPEFSKDQYYYSLMQRGRLALGKITQDDIEGVDFSEAQVAAVEARMSPKATEVLVALHKELPMAIATAKRRRLYQLLVEIYAVQAAGEEGIDSVDWNLPPELTEDEERYLTILDRIAENLSLGNYAQVKRTFKGITAFLGSSVDKYGFPCSPELITIMTGIESSVMSVILARPPEEGESKWGEKFARKITRIIEMYRVGDRTMIEVLQVELQTLAESYFKRERRVDLVQSKSSSLGVVAQAINRLVP